MKSNSAIEYSDLHINSKYIDYLRKLNYNPIVISRWFNSVSCYLNDKDISILRNCEFIKEIIPVREIKYRSPRYYQDETGLKKSISHDLDYGNSFLQNDMIRIPSA